MGKNTSIFHAWIVHTWKIHVNRTI